MNFKIILKGGALLLFIAAVFSSCSTYENRGDESVFKPMSITQFDTRADFGSYATFAVNDTMVVLKDGDTLRVSNSTSQWTVAQIRSEMTGLGYTEVAQGEKPDLYILVSGVVTSNYSYAWPMCGFYNPFYWGYDSYYWGDPYYYGGWGYYYYAPCFPMITSAYTMGSVLMEMVDIKNADIEKKTLNVVWLGIVRGIMEFDYEQKDVVKAVSDCFTQVKFK